MLGDLQCAARVEPSEQPTLLSIEAANEWSLGDATPNSRGSLDLSALFARNGEFKGAPLGDSRDSRLDARVEAEGQDSMDCRDALRAISVRKEPG
jgi:hypothetical protein